METDDFIYQFQILASIYEFKGQHHGVRAKDYFIQSNSSEEVKLAIFNEYQSLIVGRIIAIERNGELVLELERETKSFNSHGSCLQLYVPSQKRQFAINNILEDTLLHISKQYKSNNEQKVHLKVFKYGESATKNEVREVQKLIATDRSGADTEDKLNEIIKSLKEKHKDDWVATHDINWYIWATLISTKPIMERDIMISTPFPPQEIIHLFRRKEQSTLDSNETRSSCKIALNAMCGVLKEIKKQKLEIEKSERVITAYIKSINAVFQHSSQSLGIEPQLSRELIDFITDQEDVDHIY